MAGLRLQRGGRADTRTAKFDLTLEVVERQRRAVTARFEYATDLFDAATMARMAEHLDAAGAARWWRSPDAPLAQLPLLTEAERQQVLREWNDTAHGLPGADACIHDLFEAQAARTPDARRAGLRGRAAHLPRARRARQPARPPPARARRRARGAAWACALERSLELVVGLLGILKAGGAYVPLDPPTPRERLAWMLEDARPAVLLTQRALLAPAPPSGTARIVRSTGTLATRRCAADARARLASAAARQPRLRHLHLGLAPAGPRACRSRTARVANFLAGMDATPPVTRATARGCAVTRSPSTSPSWSCFWPLAARLLASWCSPTRARPTALAARGCCAEHGDHALAVHAVPGPWRCLLEAGSGGGLRSLQQMLVRRRGPAAELARELRQRVPGSLHQHVRPHRDHRLVASTDCRARSGPAARSPSAGRSPTPELYVLDAHAAAGAAGRARRAVHRRRGRGARLPRPPGAHRRALRPRPLRRRARRAPLPHRRPGALSRRRRAGVPGPHRPPGEGARLPHRARARSRPRSPRIPAVREAVVVAREDAPATSASWPTRARRGGSAPRTPADAARPSSSARCPSTWCPRPSSCSTRCRSRQRQGGPQGPAAPGRSARNRGPGSSRRGTRRSSARRDVARGAARRTRRHARQLLHARRPLADGHAVRLPGPRDLRRRTALRDLFEAPTGGRLALNILQVLSDQVDESELESMVTQLDQLGDEEIRKLLESEPPPGSG